MKCSNTKVIGILIGLMVFFTMSPNTYASKFFRWVDKNGNAHYSYTLPPSMSQDGYSKLNQTGRQIEKVSAATKEIVNETQDSDKKELTDAELLEQQAIEKRDKYLTATYISVDELTDAHLKKQTRLTDQISLYDTRIKKLESGLQKAEKQEKTTKNKKSKEKLQDYIKTTSDSINIYKEMIIENKEKLIKINQEYLKDKARLTELLSEETTNTQENS